MTMKVRMGVVALAMGAALVVSGCEGVEATPADGAPAASSGSAAPTVTLPEEVPDTVGEVLADARDTLEALGFTVISKDGVEDRVILIEGNWVVVEQKASGGDVVLLAKKSSDPTQEEIEAAEREAEAEAAEEAKQREAEEKERKAAEKAEAEQAKWTLGQRNAVRKAEDYLDYSSFSRKGLIGQLEFEGFSSKEATFAVDHVDVDWNEQAAAKAQDYLDYSSFSKQGLIDQLIFEGFTKAQAQHGVSAVGY